ncbi:MAG: hypothetical protein PHV05_08325 [Candidatus Riflebacteria bacterium]|nr:hypothetical protein [Candidatus Riflebacteria bacterium]
MRQINNIFVILLSLTAGYIGGQLGQIERPVNAQTKAVVHEELVTRRLKIVDEKGLTRVDLCVLPAGSSISLYDANEKLRSSLVVFPNGMTGLSLYDTKGKVRNSLSVFPNGTPGLFLYDANEMIRSNLTVSSENTPAIELRGANGDILKSLP